MTYQALVSTLEKAKKNSVYFIFVYPYQNISGKCFILHDGRNVSVFGVN